MKPPLGKILTVAISIFVGPLATFGGPILIDHACTDITKIPESAIAQAKATLHIAYGHTSHGSQLTSGMTGLVTFARLAGWSGPQTGDLNADGVVDLLDLAILSRHWLEEP